VTDRCLVVLGKGNHQGKRASLSKRPRLPKLGSHCVRVHDHLYDQWCGPRSVKGSLKMPSTLGRPGQEAKTLPQVHEALHEPFT